MDFLLLFILTAINGFFALAEIAVVTARSTRLKKMKGEGVWGADSALHLQQDPKYFLSTIQVGITLVVLIMGVFSGTGLSRKLESFFSYIQMPSSISHHLALILSLFFITYISILLGELVPKTIALSRPEKVACKVSPIAYFLSYLFFPFAKLLAVSTGWLTGLMGFSEPQHDFSAAELRQMVRTASEKGVIDDTQKALHEKVFYFADKRAKHLMTHADNLEYVDLLQSHEAIHSQILQFEHSKIICVEGQLSNITGIIKQREYLKAYAIHPAPNLSELIYTAHLVDENKMAEEVLQFMRFNNIIVCLVTRDGGQVVGLISLSDIFEALVGQIATEQSPYDPPFFEREDGSVLINGDAPIEILEQILPNYSVDFDQTSYSSVGGFLNGKFEGKSRVGARLTLREHVLEIVDMDGRFIDKVLVHPPANPEGQRTN
jgi:putative hemolysin